VSRYENFISDERKVGLFVGGKLILLHFTLKLSVKDFQSSDKRAIIYRAFTKVILKIIS
jgi:hypothetical protein